MSYTSTHTGIQIDNLLDGALQASTAAATYLPASNLSFLTNTSVPVSAWTSDNTYVAYPYRALISNANITANHYCEVVFSLADATSGYFAPVCESVSGGIYIYASAIPLAAITIPTIKCTLAG